MALAAEIADGWLPIYYSPRVPACTGRGWPRASPVRAPGARPDTFEIATNCQVVITDDADAALEAMKPMLGFYIGGMGAKDMNFHKNVFARMGYEKEADEIQRLFFEGKREEAMATVPDQWSTTSRSSARPRRSVTSCRRGRRPA